MDTIILSEAYINNTSTYSINGTSKAILNNAILEKYQDEILSNENGCIFKITNCDLDNGICAEEFVSCVEFSAPENMAFVSNDTYDKLLFNEESSQKAQISIYIPPQATEVVFIPSHEDIFKQDIKSQLENIISDSYMFLKEGDIIKLDDYTVTVSKLKPYYICMVNNTDLNVIFEIEPKAEGGINGGIDSEMADETGCEVACNNNDMSDYSDDNEPKPTLEELREKRVAYFTKK